MISARLIKIGPPGMIVASPIKTQKRLEKVWNDKCKPYWYKPYKDQEETGNRQE